METLAYSVEYDVLRCGPYEGMKILEQSLRDFSDEGHSVFATKISKAVTEILA